MRCFRNLVLAGIGAMAAVAIATAIEPGVGTAVSTVFLAVVVLVGLVPTVVVVRRVHASAAARRRFRAISAVQPCWSDTPAPVAPVAPPLAELRRPA